MRGNPLFRKGVFVDLVQDVQSSSRLSLHRRSYRLHKVSSGISFNHDDFVDSFPDVELVSRQFPASPLPLELSLQNDEYLTGSAGE